MEVKLHLTDLGTKCQTTSSPSPSPSRLKVQRETLGWLRPGFACTPYMPQKWCHWKEENKNPNNRHCPKLLQVSGVIIKLAVWEYVPPTPGKPDGVGEGQPGLDYYYLLWLLLLLRRRRFLWLLFIAYLHNVNAWKMLGKCFIKAVDEKMEFPSSNDVLRNGITFMCVLVCLGGCGFWPWCRRDGCFTSFGAQFFLMFGWCLYYSSVKLMMFEFFMVREWYVPPYMYAHHCVVFISKNQCLFKDIDWR